MAPVRLRMPSASAEATSGETAPYCSISSAGTSAKAVFSSFGVNDDTAEEGARTAGYRSDALRDHAAGAAFGHRESGLAQAEIVENDLLQRFAFGGVHPVIERFFQLGSEFFDALFGEVLVLPCAEQGELNVAGVGEDGGFDVGDRWCRWAREACRPATRESWRL